MKASLASETFIENLIETLSEKELADLIFKYGDERLSRKISRRIKKDLIEKGKYSGTKDLAYSIIKIDSQISNETLNKIKTTIDKHHHLNNI